MESASDAMKSVLDSAIEYVKCPESTEHLTGKITQIGRLVMPGDAQDNGVKQVRHVIDMLKKYRSDASAQRPCSVVVFGPPGSGKSHFVEEIAKEVTGSTSLTRANLTQIDRTEELAKIFSPEAVQPLQAGVRAPAPAADNNMPVYFFDEFDAALDGVPLGWLRWFLAPMQDGKVLTNGTTVPVGKAIFMFAGGTAETLDEFNLRAQINPEAYRARKVPDFVSRLRGAINIGGVNATGEERIISRAVALRKILKKPPGRTLTGERIRSLLTNGHFVHGMRSMETLIDAEPDEQPDGRLPDAIRRQHFSRGQLDGRLIGISAGLTEQSLQPMFLELTRQLLRTGAKLAYGGAFFPEGTLKQVASAARETQPEPDGQKGNSYLVRNYLGLPTWLSMEYQPDAESRNVVEFIQLDTLTAAELKELRLPSDTWFGAMPRDPHAPYEPRCHVAWALSLFRLRVRMLQDVSAVVVVGGKDDGRSWGRVAGIAEEAMIAMALGKPIYVLGGAGGAARAVGQLLGLDQAPVGMEHCLQPAEHDELNNALKPYSRSFQIPGVPDSPQTLEQLRQFLFHRGATTSAWRWNGLELQQNRDLFALPIAQKPEVVREAVGQILKGLSRISWKSANGGDAA